MHLEIPQQLNCPICMSLFKIPITTECGHSFCRSCLINSSKNKKACPICRNDLQSSPDKLKQDDTLSSILEDFLRHSLRPKKNKQNTSFPSKSQSMLLLDVKTDHLLLPYNRIPVTFELQSQILLNNCEKVVARQQAPFNKFGVISRIIAPKKLRHNLYECILEGRSFCQIQEVFQENKPQQQALEVYEQFSYRTCAAKEILETSNTNLNELQPFLAKLKEIQDPEITSCLYRQVDYNVFLHGNDPLALVYSIFELMDIDDQEKYRVLTLFDEEKRIQVIREVVARNSKKDVSFKVTGFVKASKVTGSSFSSLIAFVVLFAILLFINSGESEL